MTSDTQVLSNDFQRLYCDAGVFGFYSAVHPISFARVLPFQSQDPVVDDGDLINAEEEHLAERNDGTRQKIIGAYVRCGLLSAAEAENVTSVIDYFNADFFGLMGMVYANAGMHICALRWYRELIQELENREPNSGSALDSEEVYASIGYCLYALGLFAEAISWTKSCVGPLLISEAVCRALIGYEAQMAGGKILAIERGGPRTRYTVSALDKTHAIECTPRLKEALKSFAPLTDTYIDWVGNESPPPAVQPEGYPFNVEIDGSSMPRHKMNFIFATCAQADALIEKGYTEEAKRLLIEATMIEPNAEILLARLSGLP